VEHVHRAVQELRELQRTGDVPFRIALHLGEVTVSSVGSAGGESLLGPQLNYVFRMEKAASVNGYSNLISPSAGQCLSTLMTLESVANLDDPIFGAGQSLLTVPGNRDRSVPLSDSDGDATAQAAIWSDIDPD